MTQQRFVPSVHAQTLYVFGTLVEIVIYGEETAKAQAAIADIGARLQAYHHAWHGWRPGELTDLNSAIARGRDLVVSADLAALLHEAQRLSDASDGLFEPAIGRLIALWGFHGDSIPTGAPPNAETIASLVAAQPRIVDLQIKGRRVSSENDAVQIDLGAFAKGFALDLAGERLAQLGVQNAVLNAGGDVLVLGSHGSRAWRVAIRDPFGWGAVAAIAVRPGEAVFTSGNYERFLEHGGNRFSHILDPRTGWPVSGIVSVTVLHHDAGLADAAATALSVAGTDGWAAVAAAMGVEVALLIDGSGRIHATPAMAARLEDLPDGTIARLLKGGQPRSLELASFGRIRNVPPSEFRRNVPREAMALPIARYRRAGDASAASAEQETDHG